MRTHDPYHKHRGTKSGKLYISTPNGNGVCTWPTLRGAKRFILTTAVLSFARAQKMDNHTVAHHTTGVSTCPTLRGAKHFPSTSYFFMTGVNTVSTFFCYTKAMAYWWDADTETIHGQLLHLVSTIQERWIIEEQWRVVKSIRHLKRSNKKVGWRCASHKKSIQVVSQLQYGIKGQYKVNFSAVSKVYKTSTNSISCSYHEGITSY